MTRETNWNVFTGAPCSGKTSVLIELNKRNHRVIHEVARSYIDAQMQKGKSLAEIKSEPLAFERAILYKKIEIEKSLPARDVIFFDRAVPDSIAYYQIEGLDPAEPLKHSCRIRYRRIFVFDRLDFVKDTVRSEKPSIAAQLDLLIEESYRKLGYDPIRVPVMPVEKRTEFIVRHLATASGMPRFKKQ